MSYSIEFTSSCNRIEIMIPNFELAPNCVITELMESEDLEPFTCRNQNIEALKGLEVKEYKINIEKLQNVQQLARFINPKCQEFSRTPLAKCYDHVIQWRKEVVDLPRVSLYDPGQITPLNIYKINATMLYRSCQSYDITPEIDSSINDMYTLCCMYELPSHELRKTIRTLCLCLAKNNLALLLFNLSRQRLKWSDTLSQSIPESEYLDPLYVIERLPPTTNDEATIACIVKYRMILTEGDPLLWYEDLKTKGCILDPLYLINPEWYMMDKRYVPKYSKWYTEEEIQRLVYNEGVVSKRQLESPPQFIKGIYPELINEKTLIDLDDVLMLDDVQDTLTFDFKYVMKREELYQFIKDKMQLLHPVTLHPLNHSSILKLRRFGWEEVNDLLDLIQVSNSEYLDIEFVSKYRDGWKLLYDTVLLFRQDDISYMNIDTKVRELCEYNKSNPGFFTSKLVTLSRSADGTLSVLPCNELLGDKLFSIEDVGDESSCLRIISNVLCHTCWFYLSALGEETFDITKFEPLS